MKTAYLGFAFRLGFTCGTLLLHCCTLVAAPAIKLQSNQNITNQTQVAIPKSVFTVPKKPEEGCDPFFPESARFSGVTNVSPTVVVTTPLTPLNLQGISGSPENRLAIINGKTVAAGETIEILKGGSRIRVHCVEITAVSCTIEVGNERRELRLRGEN